MIECQSNEWKFRDHSRFAVSRRIRETGKPDEENFKQGGNSVNVDVESTGEVEETWLVGLGAHHITSSNKLPGLGDIHALGNPPAKLSLMQCTAG